MNVEYMNLSLLEIKKMTKKVTFSMTISYLRCTCILERKKRMQPPSFTLGRKSVTLYDYTRVMYGIFAL